MKQKRRTELLKTQLSTKLLLTEIEQALTRVFPDYVPEPELTGTHLWHEPHWLTPTPPDTNKQQQDTPLGETKTVE